MSLVEYTCSKLDTCLSFVSVWFMLLNIVLVYANRYYVAEDKVFMLKVVTFSAGILQVSSVKGAGYIFWNSYDWCP